MASASVKTKAVTAPDLTPPAGDVVSLTPSAPAFMGDDIDQYSGAGTSDRREDNTIPFLNLLQKGSPQCEERKPEYIRGAKAGLLCNTATGQLYDTAPDVGPIMLQAYMEVCEVEWKPNREGFVAKHPIDTPLRDQVTEVAVKDDKPDSKRRVRMLPSGNILVETAYHYMVMVETLETVVLAFSSTGLRTHRTMNTVLRNKRRRNSKGVPVILPSFATCWRFRSVWQENVQGNWFTLAADDLGLATDNEADAYLTAREFYKLAITEGVKTGAPSTPNEGEGPTIAGQSVADDGTVEDNSPL